ncbi:hypothetical protein ACSSV4_003745 [Roseovarius sp. MBR-154]|jgi:hypothetical protein
MLEMVMNSAKQFFAGKLFKDNKAAMRQLVIAAGLGVVAGVLVGLVAPVWVGAIVAGAVSGAALPVLYKDLKYA